jgi:hypothetical protein
MKYGEEVRIFAPTPLVGYGYNGPDLEGARDSFKRGLALEPDLLAADAGSTDPGPNYLGSGKTFTNPRLVKRDLEPMIVAGMERGIPVVIGTAGGSGGEPHLAVTKAIVEEIAREHGLSFKLAIIHSEQSKEFVGAEVGEGRVKRLWPSGDLTPERVARSARIVGLMGAEPYMRALRDGAQVIVAGRSDDAAMFSSFAMLNGIPESTAWLAGRLMECAAACAFPRHGFGYEGLFGVIGKDDVILEAPHPGLRCTRESVGAFLLHENQSPITHIEPSGVLDLSLLQIDEIDPRRVRVHGARFAPAREYSIRLEGAELVGYRSITVAWTRDPVLISQIDDYIARVRTRVNQIVRETLGDLEFQLFFRLIGKDAVMGPREPVKTISSHEVGIILEAIAGTEEDSATIVATARQAIKNSHYPGKLCDEGCVTFPYSPSDIRVGAVYRFGVWHVLQPADPEKMFPIEYFQVRSAKASRLPEAVGV